MRKALTVRARPRAAQHRELQRGDCAVVRARVGAKAGPGEGLVSSTVTDLVVGSGLEFHERGTHELKGVPGEWKLFAVAD